MELCPRQTASGTEPGELLSTCFPQAQPTPQLREQVPPSWYSGAGGTSTSVVPLPHQPTTCRGRTQRTHRLEAETWLCPEPGSPQEQPLGTTFSPPSLSILSLTEGSASILTTSIRVSNGLSLIQQSPPGLYPRGLVCICKMCAQNSHCSIGCCDQTA